MKTNKKNIGIVIYANPDAYPPLLNTVQILAKEYNLVIICRNQDKMPFIYPDNVTLCRLGRFMTCREKETQPMIMKILEYIIFVMHTVFYVRYYNCRLIYSYDMHGFVSAFFASRLGKRTTLIYHNFDLVTKGEAKGLNCIIKHLELQFSHYADKVIFSDINRARFFMGEAKLTKLPDIVMNSPLRIDNLPFNRLKEFLTTKGFNEDTKVILYQGSITEGHSILEIVRSMVLWPKDTILALSGYIYADFMRNLYKESKALNLTRRVIYLPFVPYSQVFSYTVGAYIGLALFKSKNINQIFVAGASNKIFEYISMGVPMITNDSPYFQEVLDSSIVYFAKPDSVKDIAEAVNSAFSDPEEHRRKSQAARLAHLTKFNYGEQFKPIIEYIRELSERRNS